MATPAEVFALHALIEASICGLQCADETAVQVEGRNAEDGEVAQRTRRKTLRPRRAFPLCSLRSASFYRMFTARAARSATVANEMSACTIISVFAQRESTGESVGENAVLVLNAMNR